MLNHDPTGKLLEEALVKHCCHDVMKAMLDFLYGRQIENPSIHLIIDMLNAAKKFDIKRITVS